jgi:hypothetical protein
MSRRFGVWLLLFVKKRSRDCIKTVAESMFAVFIKHFKRRLSLLRNAKMQPNSCKESVSNRKTVIIELVRANRSAKVVKTFKTGSADKKKKKVNLIRRTQIVSQRSLSFAL